MLVNRVTMWMCLCMVVFLCVFMGGQMGSSTRTVDRGFTLQLVLSPPQTYTQTQKRSTGIGVCMHVCVAAAMASGGGPIVHE